MRISLNSGMFEQNLFRMYSELTPDQRDWFTFTFPTYIGGWMSSEFQGKQDSAHPDLHEDYLTHSDNYSEIKSLDKFIYALWCVRKCYGPIRVPALYRMTAYDNKLEVTEALFKTENELKALTSWSTHKDINVVYRDPTPNDYLLTYENPQPKHILASTAMLDKLVRIVRSNPQKFNIPQHSGPAMVFGVEEHQEAAYDWEHAASQLRRYLSESEYMIYLPKSDSFRVTLEPLKY